MIHYEDLHDNFEENILKLTSFLNFDILEDEAMCRLKQLVSVGQMKVRYADAFVTDFVNQGKKNAWNTTMPTDFIQRFDSMTKKYFKDDELLAKFL